MTSTLTLPRAAFMITGCALLLMFSCQSKSPSVKSDRVTIDKEATTIGEEDSGMTIRPSVRLSSEASAVAQGTPITLSLAIENTGHEELRIVRFHENVFVIRDEDGRRVNHTSMTRDYPVPIPDDVISLGFGEFFGYHEDISIDEPGEYTITAVVTKGDWRDKLGHDIWTGTTTSNVIRLRVYLP